MQNNTINNRLRKNLPINVIYNSQAAAIIVAVGFAFKLSAAPGIICETYGSSTLWIYLLFSLVDALLATLVFAFSRMKGDDLLVALNCKFFKICCLLSSVWLTMKLVFYFCYCMSYLTHELFTGTQPFLIYGLFILPIVYLGAKGTKTIARTAELFALFAVFSIIANLAFLDTNLDIGRNLPVFSMPPSEFFAKAPRFGLWIGDMFPFAFVRIKDKKLPYITTTVACVWTLVNAIVMLGIALYGNALKMVSDLLIHIASFNQLSLEIGRMEWTNLFMIIAMSIISMAFLYDGANKTFQRATGSATASKILCPLAVLVTAFSVTSSQTVTDFALGAFGYALFLVAVILPMLLTFTAAFFKQKYRHILACLDSEYIPYPKPNPTPPDSANCGKLQPSFSAASSSGSTSSSAARFDINNGISDANRDVSLNEKGGER